MQRIVGLVGTALALALLPVSPAGAAVAVTPAGRAAEPPGSPQPGGASMTPGSFHLDYRPDTDGAVLVGVTGPFATLRDLPAGVHTVHVTAQYALRTGCLDARGRSDRRHEQRHRITASDASVLFAEAPEPVWQAETTENLGFATRPDELLPADCPAGATPGIVRWRARSATVRYGFTPVSPEGEYGDERLGAPRRVRASVSWSNA